MEKHDYHHNHNQNYASPELVHSDMIKEILLRLPIKSLLRFRGVCKQWRDLIQHPDFIKVHMSRATPLLVSNCDFITHSDFASTASHHPANLSAPYYQFSILGIFEGLVVEILPDILQVRNPATRQALVLPRQPSSKAFPEMHFNFNSRTGVATLLCEKLDTFGNRRNKDLQISSFNIENESFLHSNFPLDIFADLPEPYPFWWNNCLAVGALTGNKLRVLVLEKQHGEGNGEYKCREEVFVPLRFLDRNPDRKEGLVPIAAVSDDLWFSSQGTHKWHYDMKTEEIKEWSLIGVKMLEYQPSLKMLDGMLSMKDDWNNQFHT
ncbi:F-box domain containing protein [Trema orientale]|uniref:F-box domain containing protein n=1 Tax=Trema orientale TaxID=63057 RepID=A0A2P5FEJ2_TREOI|nr:F-box domain containing protein [Trema orientale]